MLIVICAALGVLPRIRHPDGWFFKVEDEAKTLGIVYGRGFNSAQMLVAGNVGQMYGLMDQYRRVWATNIALRTKCQYLNSIVWSKGRWSLHIFHFTKHLKQALDSAQARMLRRIAKIPAAYISRVSHAEVRKRCKTVSFSTQILKAQFRWLGHVLRRPETHPLRLVCFEPHTDLRPRLTGTHWTKKRGRPRTDWAQALIAQFCTFTQKTRSELCVIVKDKRRYHQYVERLCGQVERNL